MILQAYFLSSTVINFSAGLFLLIEDVLLGHDLAKEDN